MTPSQFRNLSTDDQVEIIATENVLSKMSEWESYQDQLKQEADEAKARAKRRR